MGYKTEKEAIKKALKAAKNSGRDRFIVREELYDNPDNYFQVADLLELETFFAGRAATLTITPAGTIHPFS